MPMRSATLIIHAPTKRTPSTCLIFKSGTPAVGTPKSGIGPKELVPALAGEGAEYPTTIVCAARTVDVVFGPLHE